MNISMNTYALIKLWLLLSFKRLKSAQLIQFGFIPICNMSNAFLSLEGLVNPVTALLEEKQ